MAKGSHTGSKGFGSTDNPSTSYAKKSFGGGGRSSQVIKTGGSGSSTKFIGSGIQMGDKSIGTKRFDLSTRSLNRGSRGMK